MKVKCTHCGADILSTDEKCPGCGAVNDKFQRTTNDTPKTIEELKEFCKAKSIPLNSMRVHIGENYKLPKAFGIYKNETTGKFVVYKNKSDGSRAIRYEGDDEAYAVNEIYQKMRELVDIARERHAKKAREDAEPFHIGNPNYKIDDRTWWKKALDAIGDIPIIKIFTFLGVAIVIGVYAWAIIMSFSSTKRGYYEYDNHFYYYGGGEWYEYDDGWSPAENVSEDLTTNHKDYYQGKEYYTYYNVDDFDDSEYYNPKWDEKSDYEWDNDDWDDDDDWGDSGWDDDDWSGGVDWDSDW